MIERAIQALVETGRFRRINTWSVDGGDCVICLADEQGRLTVTQIEHDGSLSHVTYDRLDVFKAVIWGAEARS